MLGCSGTSGSPWHRRGSLAALLVSACSVYDASLFETTERPAMEGASGHANAGQSAVSGGGRGGNVATAGGNAGSTGGAVATAGRAGASGGVGVEAGGAGGGDEPSFGGEGGNAPERDDCPADPDKLAPGFCGCGVPDVATATQADCQALVDKLVHRYDFEGAGTAVTDRVGTSHGTLKNASLSKLSGKGVVLFGGGTSGAYVDLPNRLLSSLTNATLEAWVTWGGGAARQRVFDFGDSNNASPENNPGVGKTYLMLTPSGSGGHATLGFSLNSSSQELNLVAATPLPMSLAQVVVVVSDTDNELRLYIDGKKAGAVAWTSKLAGINDVNAWLGRSQYDGDPELSAVFHEFRVYAAALKDAEVASSFVGGPDPVFLAY